MLEEEEAKKRVEEGWIKSWVAFEALAINEEVAKNALETLISKLEKDERVRTYGKKFGDVKKVEKPLEGIESGYSVTAELNVISKNFENLSEIAIEYGPSAVEVIEPNKIEMKIGEAQSVLNNISNMMHRLAASGAGGIVFMKAEE